ncbi:MAG: hypothetical protein O2973_05260 [Gemmatimonadetes bacterium]|nr:hypothetical protein [Gemmatimonadota bacterium]
MIAGSFTRGQPRGLDDGRAVAVRSYSAALTSFWLVCVLWGLRPSVLPAQDPVASGVRIGLTYDRSGKPGVALTPVVGANADSVRLILGRDLDFSDRLTVIAPDSGDAPVGGLNYVLYARMNAVAVVQAAVTPSGGLHVSVHDVAGKRVISVIDVPLPEPALSPDWRHAVHVVSDSIELAVLGQRGISSSRVMFVRGNEIWSVDADGEGLRVVPGTVDGLSPAWSAAGNMIAYNTLPGAGGPSKIVVRDVLTGRSWSTRAAATNMNPAFSPDGGQLVFAAGTDGFDLYSVAPFTSDEPKRLTARKGSLNSSPTFSPDGRKIAYTSGILGHPEVYIVDADGSNADLLTSSGFGDQLYRSNPSWSPDGRLVAFQSRINGKFQLFTISVRDKSARQLTSEGENEDPSWAADGRHLVFVSTRTGTKQLWVMDMESSRARQLTHGGKVQNPAWSPRLDFSRQY